MRNAVNEVAGEAKGELDSNLLGRVSDPQQLNRLLTNVPDVSMLDRLLDLVSPSELEQLLIEHGSPEAVLEFLQTGEPTP